MAKIGRAILSRPWIHPLGCALPLPVGWNPGTEQEIFSREELIQAFSLSRMSRVNSVFNFKPGDPKFFTDPKLIAINEHYLRTMDLEELGAMVRNELEAAGLWKVEYATTKKQLYLDTLGLIRDRLP